MREEDLHEVVEGVHESQRTAPLLVVQARTDLGMPLLRRDPIIVTHVLAVYVVRMQHEVLHSSVPVAILAHRPVALQTETATGRGLAPLAHGNHEQQERHGGDEQHVLQARVRCVGKIYGVVTVRRGLRRRRSAALP